jgi:hypothetical protein
MWQVCPLQPMAGIREQEQRSDQTQELVGVAKEGSRSNRDLLIISVIANGVSSD